MTLLVGGGEPGLLGSQAVLAPQNHLLLTPVVQFASPTPIFQTSFPSSPSPELVCKCLGVQCVMMDQYFCHMEFLPTFLIPSFHVGRSTDIPMGSPSLPSV